MADQMSFDMPVSREIMVLRHGNQRTLHMAYADTRSALCGSAEQYDARQSLTVRLRPRYVPAKWRDYRKCLACGRLAAWSDVLE